MVTENMRNIIQRIKIISALIRPRSFFIQANATS